MTHDPPVRKRRPARGWRPVAPAPAGRPAARCGPGRGSERGSATIAIVGVIGLAAALLLAVAGLAQAVLARQAAQATADLSALAGVQVLLDGGSGEGACQLARRVASVNQGQVASCVPDLASGQLEVRIRVPMRLAGVPTEAQALARAGPEPGAGAGFDRASGQVIAGAATAEAGSRAVIWAYGHLGDPYVWGATGPDSFDCSGLTQQAWLNAGVRIPRVAVDQYRAAAKIPYSQLRPGDLIFYGSSAESIDHVTMYVGEGYMIEAPRPGRTVTVTPVRYAGAMPYAGRPVGG